MGFEPTTSSLEGWRPIHARQRAHEIDYCFLGANTIVIIKYFYGEVELIIVLFKLMVMKSQDELKIMSSHFVELLLRIH